MKKIIITLLLLVLFSALLVSCNEPSSPEITDTVTVETDAESENETEVIEKTDFELKCVGKEHSIEMSWTKVDGADKYEIYANTDGGENFEALGQLPRTSFNYKNLPWGKTYSFYIKALKDGRPIAKSNVCEVSVAGVRVNGLAPKDDVMTVYAQQVGSEKSDGFVVSVNGEIYIIDSGRSGDTQVNDYLMSLRKKWLEMCGMSELENDKNAKLAVNFIISHSHADHVNAVPEIIENTFLSVERVYAPVRSYLGTEGVDGAIPRLVKCEDRIDTVKAKLSAFGHGASSVTHVPFGEHISVELENSDARLDLYPALFDWSETRDSALEGWKYILSTAKNDELTYTNTILNWNCLWAKFTNGKQSVLFTGDTGDSTNVINKMMDYYGAENFDCDVLKYIHHGEVRYSSYLTQMTSPKVTLFTAVDGTANKNAYSSSLLAGDVYMLCKGDLTLTLDGKSIKAEGISPE